MMQDQEGSNTKRRTRIFDNIQILLRGHVIYKVLIHKKRMKVLGTVSQCQRSVEHNAAISVIFFIARGNKSLVISIL
jgi:hypothetical protein